MTHNLPTTSLEYLKRLVAVKKGRIELFNDEKIPGNASEQGSDGKRNTSVEYLRTCLENRLGFLRKKEIHLHISQAHGRDTSDWIDNHRAKLEMYLCEAEREKTMSSRGDSPYAAWQSMSPGAAGTLRFVYLKRELALIEEMKRENRQLLGSIEKAIARTRVMIDICTQSLDAYVLSKERSLS